MLSSCLLLGIVMSPCETYLRLVTKPQMIVWSCSGDGNSLLDKRKCLPCLNLSPYQLVVFLTIPWNIWQRPRHSPLDHHKSSCRLVIGHDLDLGLGLDRHYLPASVTVVIYVVQHSAVTEFVSEIKRDPRLVPGVSEGRSNHRTGRGVCMRDNEEIQSKQRKLFQKVKRNQVDSHRVYYSSSLLP